MSLAEVVRLSQFIDVTYLLYYLIIDSACFQAVSWYRQQFSQLSGQRDASLAPYWQLRGEHGLSQCFLQ